MTTKQPSAATRASEIAARAIKRGAVQKQAELEQLVALLLADPPVRILEIGTDQGGTLQAWTDCAMDDATLVSIDLEHGPWSSGEYRGIIRRPDQTLQRFLGDSHHPSIRIHVGRYAPFDFLFIDGDHTAEGAHQDWFDYSPLVRPGGLIAFHDICTHPAGSGVDVAAAWDKVRAVTPWSQEIITEPTNWGGIGITRK